MIRLCIGNGYEILLMPAEKLFTDHKIISINEISNRARSWKQESRKLVFTNGCFDILHSGHVKYLQTAAGFGDILVIGGIKKNNVTNTQNQVPGIGDLPGVGNLFKGKSKADIMTELLVFIAPRIL